MFQVEGPREISATERAEDNQSATGRILHELRRIVLGPSLASSAVVHERMRKLIALPVLSGDLLSSVAYGPEAMIAVHVLAGSGALRLELPVGFCLLALMIIVGASYRQTIRAYPSGGGSYIVATDNLGEIPGLAAAAGLMTDYILTVSVSVAAGVAAVTSALPSLRPETVLVGVAVIAVLLAGNLRGVRQAGNLFAIPTFLFLSAMAVLIVAGFVKASSRDFTALPAPHLTAVAVLGPLLILRAFASGATSMTGIEAVSNAVPAFQPVQWRNARTVLSVMVTILVLLLLGLLVLVHLQGLVPNSHETLLSQLAAGVIGRGALTASSRVPQRWSWCSPPIPRSTIFRESCFFSLAMITHLGHSSGWVTDSRSATGSFCWPWHPRSSSLPLMARPLRLFPFMPSGSFSPSRCPRPGW
jgi:amino acid transporter